MKKAIVSALCFAAVLSFCACQSTPTEEAVKNKGNGALERELLEKSTGSQKDSAKTGWNEELESKDGAIRIHVNAKVNWPEKDQLPVVYVRPHAFSISEVETMVQKLFGDSKLYNDDYSQNKAGLEKEIISWRADLESLKTTGKWSELSMDESMRGMKDSPETLQQNIEWVQTMLDKAERAYESAPDTIPEVTKLDYKKAGGMKTIALRDDQTIPASIGVSVIEGVDQSGDSYLEYRDWKGAEYRTASVLEDSDTLAMQTTRETAMETAVDFIKSIGLDCSVTAVKSARDGNHLAYLFIFSRNIEGVPCIYTESSSVAADGTLYREPWSKERIEVMVNDDGIIGFEWQSPPEILETVNDDVAIKTYDEILETARTILPMQFAKEALAEKQREVTIGEVTLSMMRIAKTGTDNEYYYLPIWDFIGYYGDSLNQNISEENPSATKSFLTLNAVDGSVIDRGLGY